MSRKSTYSVEDAFQFYSLGFTLRETAAHFGVAAASIYERFKRRGFVCRTRGKRPLLIEQCKLAQNMLNPESAYWLGLALADGYLRKRQTLRATSYALVITLSSKDKALLDKFCDYTGAKCHACGPRAVQAVTAQSPDWAWLLKYGFGQNKTTRLKWPVQMPDQSVPAFVRGFFDGDGWVTLDRNYGVAGCVSVSKAFLRALANWLRSYGIESKLLKHNVLGSKTKILGKPTIRKIQCYKLVVRKYASFKKLYEILYQDNGPHLIRKKDKFVDILQHRANLALASSVTHST